MKRVLIAPLDWGLGHAARCVPVVRELQRQGCEVFIAGSGDSLLMLQKEFPSLESFSLPAYAPRYPANDSMASAMVSQLPRFMRVIAAEHKAVEKIVERAGIDLLISDNRYGCWSEKINSVFITHQSNIQMPKRFGWLQHIVRRANEKMINRFDSCWIPDLPGQDSLAGELIGFGSHALKIKTQYIGWLSRFKSKTDNVKKYEVLAIFSGPEPQRTLLENTVLPQLKASRLKYRAVRGLPGLNNKALTDDSVVNFLSSEALQHEVDAAALVIARSGYSTVMDMRALGKNVVFIPTPGQTEQEYLAKRLMENGIAFSMDQKVFDLPTAMKKSQSFPGFKAFEDNALLQQAIRDVLHE